jgi:hypothetical protein
MELNMFNNFHEELLIAPVLSQINSVSSLSHRACKIHFNDIFPLHMFQPSSILNSTVLIIFGEDYKSLSCFV